MVCPVCIAIPLAFSGAVVNTKNIKIYIFFLVLTFIISILAFYLLYIRKKNCKDCIS